MVLWPLLLHTLYSLIYIYIYIYEMTYVFFIFFSHVLFLFYLYTYVSFCIQLVYVSHLMPWWIFLSVSDKVGCKSIMPWSLFLQSFQEFVVGLDLCTFVNYGIVVLDFSYNCFLWVLSWIAKREIVRVIFYCNWLILWQNALYL